MYPWGTSKTLGTYCGKTMVLLLLRRAHCGWNLPVSFLRSGKSDKLWTPSKLIPVGTLDEFVLLPVLDDLSAPVGRKP